MFFVAMARGFDAVEIERAALLCAGCDRTAPGQPAARAWVRSLEAAPGALICVGKEAEDLLAFSAGALERDETGSSFILHELCVSTRRTESGIGSELLNFTLRQAHARGAHSAVATARLEARGAAFLLKQGFARDGAEAALRRMLAPPG